MQGDLDGKLTELGFEVARKSVLLDDTIKSLGVYTVDVRLPPHVVGQVKVWIVKE